MRAVGSHRNAEEEAGLSWREIRVVNQVPHQKGFVLAIIKCAAQVMAPRNRGVLVIDVDPVVLKRRNESIIGFIR